ncbi:hypothetical protein WA026_023578 [Henosepilachna vigintioctopunctata]|uniref:Ubiquitin-conjugating enzyme E2 Z n=1 Tax=Henosepilachna vigintioctopunctata TaxID=420089 RepID=A0AAW1V3B7_9CUCU
MASASTKDSKIAVNYWDPLRDTDSEVLSATASTRIRRDLMTIFKDPPPGLFVVGDESDIRYVHAIIVGVMDTPYEGGFFYFILKCPSDYPIVPPKVKFMTTDAGRVRFNPNLYKNGKVCLSILGTWTGPAWSPAQQISTVLLSIQSLMNEKPYFNEPGYEKERWPGDVERYNEILRHETLRVAVCGMLENECHLIIPEQLKEIMETTFLQFYDLYMETSKNKIDLDGKSYTDPFGAGAVVTFEYAKILERLETIRGNLAKKHAIPVDLPLTDGEGSDEKDDNDE